MELRRLKAIRKAKGLSLRALAERVGVSHTYLHLIETGEREPDKEVLKRLLKVLHVNESFLKKESPIYNITPYYRIEKGARKKDLDMLREEIVNLLEIYNEIENLAYDAELLERERQRSSTLIHKYKVRDPEEIEDIVIKVREDLGAGRMAIRNVTEFLEDLGVKVIYVDGFKDFWAMAFEIEGDNPIIALRRGIAGDRGRFSLVHELGHIVLSIDGSLDTESVVHRFAGAFLLPRAECIRQFGTYRKSIGLEELKIAKFKYGVSMTSILHRLLDVGIISEYLYKKYRGEFSKRGWITREPVELEKESPTKIKRLLLILEQEGVLSVEERLQYEHKLFGIWGI